MPPFDSGFIQGQTGLPLSKMRRGPGFVPGTDWVRPRDKPGLSLGQTRGRPKTNRTKKFMFMCLSLAWRFVPGNRGVGGVSLRDHQPCTATTKDFGSKKGFRRGWCTNSQNLREQQNVYHPQDCTGDVHHGFCGVVRGWGSMSHARRPRGLQAPSGVSNFQKNPRVRKNSCPQFWGRRWLRQFYGHLEKTPSFCRKTYVYKIPRFGGGVFWVWGGGGSADFIFMGARIFLKFKVSRECLRSVWSTFFLTLRGQFLDTPEPRTCRSFNGQHSD